MNDNNQIPLKLEALYSEPFLTYLSLQELGRLRQTNKELYGNSRLKNILLSHGKTWVSNKLWHNHVNAAQLNAQDLLQLRQTILKIVFNATVKKYDNADLYSFYLFLGGNLLYDHIREKAKQERHTERWRERAIYAFSCAMACGCMCCDENCRPGLSLCLIVPSAILCLSIPPCVPSLSCGWLTYTGAATLGTTAGGTTIACLEKKFHIFTCCCDPYKHLVKIDQAHDNAESPARIAMQDEEPVPIQAALPPQRNSLANCFKGLFFKRNAAPTERSPLITENNSCDPEPSHVTKSL